MMLQDAAISTPGGDEVVWSAVTAWSTAKLIEWAKGKPWIPWVAADAARANRIVSWLVAFGLSAGLLFTFDGDHFAISGSLSGLASAAAHAIRQVMFQEVAYKKFVKETK